MDKGGSYVINEKGERVLVECGGSEAAVNGRVEEAKPEEKATPVEPTAASSRRRPLTVESQSGSDTTN